MNNKFYYIVPKEHHKFHFDRPVVFYEVFVSEKMLDKKYNRMLCVNEAHAETLCNYLNDISENIEKLFSGENKSGFVYSIEKFKGGRRPTYKYDKIPHIVNKTHVEYYTCDEYIERLNELFKGGCLMSINNTDNKVHKVNYDMTSPNFEDIDYNEEYNIFDL